MSNNRAHPIVMVPWCKGNGASSHEGPRIHVTCDMEFLIIDDACGAAIWMKIKEGMIDMPPDSRHDAGFPVSLAHPQQLT